jgi:hypothetical protein
MPKYIVKLAEGRYCRWSSVVDSPVSYLTDTREEAVSEFGLEDIEIADRVGCSCCGRDGLPGENHVSQLLNSNAAGVNEENISLEEILKVWKKPN